MRSSTRLIAPAKRISLQMSTLLILPRHWRESVRHSPLADRGSHLVWHDTATAHGPISQRSFLLHMGIGTRVAALQQSAASPERADTLEKAVARLVDAAGMGGEYKVMGVTGGVGKGEELVWPFVAGEVQNTRTDSKESAR